MPEQKKYRLPCSGGQTACLTGEIPNQKLLHEEVYHLFGHVSTKTDITIFGGLYVGTTKAEWEIPIL